MVQSHEHDPFHVPEMWTVEKGFWEKTSLGALGLVVALGHEGTCCMLNPSPPRKICLVHTSGIQFIYVAFCDCKPSSGDDLESTARQLLEMDLWPATWKRPGTAFTLEVLDTFLSLSSRASLSAQSYYSHLQRATDGVLPHKIKVSK